MKALSAEIDPTAARSAGSAATQRMLMLPELARARRVAMYSALADELPCRELFETLRRRGTPTLFPRCLEDRRLGFGEVDRWEDLLPGRYGVAEPEGPAVALEPDDVVVIPGRAFDARGHRLGRGRGFYDRTFPASGSAPFLVGACFAFQRVDRVPAGPDDRAMDAVVTDRETLRAGEEEQA